MKYTRQRINTATPEPPKARVMIIYTGGTFGMSYNSGGILVPFDFSLILEHLPTLRNLFLDLTVISFEKPVDSSNIDPSHWTTIGQIIYDNYNDHDGFVVLHGTDTMAYTASALSFMIQGLRKPVILTGAQLPISEPRSDARENLITSLEIASRYEDGMPVVPEVCIYFDYQLLRGNRSKKVESEHFDAFESGNYPPLATAGVKIDYNMSAIHTPAAGERLSFLGKFDTSVSILKLFPGIQPTVVQSILGTPGLKALILETFGSGNGPTASWFIDMLAKAIKGGMLILNVSQCPGGMVMQGRYETSRLLGQIGVIGGADMTTEAALTKLMVLMGEYGTEGALKRIGVSISGELTEDRE
jgi:L-asparaginase